MEKIRRLICVISMVPAYQDCPEIRVLLNEFVVVVVKG